MDLPNEQQQHEEVKHQSLPAAARPQEVGSECVAAVTVVEAPAEVKGEGHVEEQQLKNSNSIRETALQEVSIDEQSKDKAGTLVAIYQFSYEPRTYGCTQVEQQQRVVEGVYFTDKME